MATSDERRSALERLQKAIASGTYTVDALSVAAAILADLESLPTGTDHP